MLFHLSYSTASQMVNHTKNNHAFLSVQVAPETAHHRSQTLENKIVAALCSSSAFLATAATYRSGRMTIA